MEVIWWSQHYFICLNLKGRNESKYCIAVSDRWLASQPSLARAGVESGLRRRGEREGCSGGGLRGPQTGRDTTPTLNTTVQSHILMLTRDPFHCCYSINSKNLFWGSDHVSKMAFFKNLISNLEFNLKFFDRTVEEGKPKEQQGQWCLDDQIIWI